MQNWSQKTYAERIAHLKKVLELVVTIPESRCYLDAWGTAPDGAADKPKQAENLCGTKFCLGGWIAHDPVLGPEWDLDLYTVKTERYDPIQRCYVPSISFALGRRDSNFEGKVFECWEDFADTMEGLDPTEVLDDYEISNFLFDQASMADELTDRQEMIYRLISLMAFYTLQEARENAMNQIGLVLDADGLLYNPDEFEQFSDFIDAHGSVLEQRAIELDDEHK